jgi:dipeptidyl aminopeptidase/acylaminoacyl peptidase
MRTLRFAALLLAVASPIALPTALVAQQAPDTRLTGQDLFSLEAAADPQIAPDGGKIAFVRRVNDIMADKAVSSIWLVDVGTGEMTPVAAGPGGHSQPRWSPDGKRLAYVSTAEGGAPQLFVRWMASGEAVRITGLPESPGNIAWSPDGTQIAYTMFVPAQGPKLGKAPEKPEGATWAAPLETFDLLAYRADGAGYLKPGFDKVFVVPATGGAPRQLSFGDYHDGGGLTWSRDGKTLYFSGNRTPDWENDPQDAEIHALDIATGAITALTDRDGPDASPVVSPDGSKIAYLGFDDKLLGYHNTQAYVMNRDGSGKRAVAPSLDRNIDTLVWAPDGQALIAQYDDHGETLVARIGLDGSVREIVRGLTGPSLDRPYSGGSFSVARTGAIAYSGGNGTKPADVMLASGGKMRALTRLNQSIMASKRLGEVRKMTTASTFDGRAIEGWLTLPPDHVPGTRVPLVLEIHGGPFAAYGPHFSTDNQLYAAAGYAVLSVNPRGSTSYGAEFANLIHHAYPGNDYDDLISMVDKAIADGIVDPDQLFVTGGSGGGVLTSWIVGKTDRFKAAATQKPVINWTSQALTADNPAFFAKYWFGKMPWEDQASYWARSPLSLVANVKTPTLVVVGSEDYRTPVSESEQYYTALKLVGVPTALVKVPGASHGGIAARPSQSAAKASAIIAWFERYRKPAAQ